MWKDSRSFTWGIRRGDFLDTIRAVEGVFCARRGQLRQCAPNCVSNSVLTVEKHHTLDNNRITGSLAFMSFSITLSNTECQKRMEVNLVRVRWVLGRTKGVQSFILSPYPHKCTKNQPDSMRMALPFVCSIACVETPGGAGMGSGKLGNTRK